MKKNYEAPSLEVTKFETEDVLNSSNVIIGSGTDIHPGVLPINPT